MAPGEQPIVEAEHWHDGAARLLRSPQGGVVVDA
jgi:hypothetical protein